MNKKGVVRSYWRVELMFIVILPLGIMLSYSSQCLLVCVIFNFFVLFLVNLLLGDKQEFKF